MPQSHRILFVASLLQFLVLIDNFCFISSYSMNFFRISSDSSTDHPDYNVNDYDGYDHHDPHDGPRIHLGKFKLSDEADDVRFLLFPDPNNENVSQELLFEDLRSIQDSKFNSSERTVVVIHGFWSNSSSGMPVTIKKGFLDARVPYNIIVVDWGKLSAPDPQRGVYAPIAYPIIVRRNIPIVYERVADFIQFLVNNNLTTLDKIHIIGHSLGAHVSGGVGYTIATNFENNGAKVARITGLDPAGPLFQGINVQRRLNKEDAEFVDIYHTAAGTLGNLIYDEGHADFFPNGGHHQPGCVDLGRPLLEAEFGSCSHSFASKIYAASVTRNFTACKCDPKFYDFVLTSSCPGNCSEAALAGEPCSPSARGQFYFETSEDPFSDEDPDLESTTNADASFLKRIF